MKSISLVVADDHPLFREGVIRTLAVAEDIEVIAEAGNAEEAIVAAREHLPDVVLLDVSMPGSGLKAAEEIARTCPVVNIVMLTVSEDEEVVHKALKAGASGYVLKGVSGPDLIAIIRNVQAGESYITPSLAASLLQSSNREKEAQNALEELTPREKEILTHLARGSSNKQIASALDIGERTVKHHMTNILQKLHLKNRVEAALFGQKVMPERREADD